MPRITVLRGPAAGGDDSASMRPGRNAPDNRVEAERGPHLELVASMRPGRNAPDNPPRGRARLAGHPPASMRPGRNAPDNLPSSPVAPPVTIELQ